MECADERGPTSEPDPMLPKLRHKPQRKGNVGPGKIYGDLAAFEADLAAFEVERGVHKARMADRKKALDAKRDRSGRQRDGENETDSERRVRQRQEDATAVAAHAQHVCYRRRVGSDAGSWGRVGSAARMRLDVSRSCVRSVR